MSVTYTPAPPRRRKKPRKWIAFTALMLSAVIILFCAANTGEQRLYRQTYQQTLDGLLLQYGANENYGLQSVSLVDFWQDGVPELVVVRTLDETDYGKAATYLMIYEYCDGEAHLRLENEFDGGADILWKRDETGLHLYGSTALTHPADYPGVRQLIALTMQADADWQSKTCKYVQINDGRWIDHGNGYSDEGRLLTDEESAVLLKDAKSLLGKDWKRFLKNNHGTACYQRAYLDILIHLQSIRKDPRYTRLVDFNGDGYPEMVTTANDKLYFYHYDPESGKADLVWGEELGCPYGEEDKRLFGINLTLERPTLIIYFGPNPKSEFIEIYQWDEGAPIRRMPKCTLQARGDESGYRDNMHDWHSWYDDLTQGEYEELRLHYLQNAVLFDTRYHSPSISGNDYTDPREFHFCTMELMVDEELPQPMQTSSAAFDSCCDIAPASRADLMFSEEMGITPPVSSQAAPAEKTEPAFSASYGKLTYQGKTYGLPQYSPLAFDGPTVEQVGKHLLVSTHVSPDHNIYDVFNTETLTFENSFWGLALGWQEDDLSSLIYCQWNELYTYNGFSFGTFAQMVDPNVLRVEGGQYSPDGKAFTVTYSDDTLLAQEETFPVPGKDILEAANLLNGRLVWRNGLRFCATVNVLNHEEAQTLATELVSLYGPCAQWPFESAQVSHTQSGNIKLTLMQPHEPSRLCLAYLFYQEPDGTIWRAEDAIIDGYSGTLVYENDSCALIASRRTEGCLLGGEPCGDCFVTDLYLWNDARTERTLLLEGAPLAINFTVLDTPDKTGILSISYDTGPSHSEYSTKVFADIDLMSKTYIETAREHLPV